MAEALLMASRAGGGGEAIASYFEVHVLRDERWVIDCTSPSAEDALANAQDLVRRTEVLGVKVIHERYNPRTDMSAARIVHSAIKPPRPRVLRLAPIGLPRPATASPVDHSHGEAPSDGGAPSSPSRSAHSRTGLDLPPPGTGSWQLFAWASLGLAVTAALLFVLLLLAG